MELTARSPSCFSSVYLLKLNGRAVGEFKGRWFSENMDIRLTDHRRWQIHREGWRNGTFTLLDDADNVFGTAKHQSWFSSKWQLQLSVGACELISAGLFNTGYVLQQRGREIAVVRSIGACEGGWSVHSPQDNLNAADLLLTGLIYHVVLQRHRNSAAAAV